MSGLLSLMTDIARSCGEKMKKYDPHALNTREKTSSRDVVTEYDTAIQGEIINRLLVKYPAAGVVAEEGLASAIPYRELVFVIDPIDGTMNFVKGFSQSCVSIGCLKQGAPYAGVVYNPFTEEIFTAERGCGAFLNSRPIHVTDSPLSDTVVVFGTAPYNSECNDETFSKLRSVYPRCLDVRRMGSAALDICSVACGRAGLYFEAKLSLWDYTAAAAILLEAGGRLLDFEGRPIPFRLEKTPIIAGSEQTILDSGFID